MELRIGETGERQPGYRRNLGLRPGAIVQAQLSEYMYIMIVTTAGPIWGVGGGRESGCRGEGRRRAARPTSGTMTLDSKNRSKVCGRGGLTSNSRIHELAEVLVKINWQWATPLPAS